MVSTLDHRQMSLDDNHINLIKTYWIDAQKGCPSKEQWPRLVPFKSKRTFFMTQINTKEECRRKNVPQLFSKT